MTIILKERTGETLRVSRVPAETIAELRAMLPADLTLTELPDETQTDDPRVRPAGYFGLAVALARQTWRTK